MVDEIDDDRECFLPLGVSRIDWTSHRLLYSFLSYSLALSCLGNQPVESHAFSFQCLSITNSILWDFISGYSSYNYRIPQMIDKKPERER